MKLFSRLLRSNEAPRYARDGDGFQFDGFESGRIHTKCVDTLSDDQLLELNRLLPWKCFTVDSHGRRFGNRAWPGKREKPQIIPDSRIVRMDKRFSLSGKQVLEFGCFEGVHTVALCGLGARVSAVDARLENVVKTIVRAAMFGHSPAAWVCNIEEPVEVARLPQVDLVHHVGVLYHLKDPVAHLLSIGGLVGEGLMLDTHFATPEVADREYESAGRRFRYRSYKEGGKAEVFSGMYDHAKWLLLDDIKQLLAESGFPQIEVLDERHERNGARVLLFAARKS